jgi:minor extracellular serine protease Vpr
MFGCHALAHASSTNGSHPEPQTLVFEEDAIAVSGPIVRDTFILVLDQPPLLALREQNLTALKDSKSGKVKHQLSTASQQKLIAAQQLEITAEIQKRFPSARVSKRYENVINGIVVSSDIPGALATLEQLPGVKYVVRDELVRAHMDVSLPLIKAPEAWSLVGGRDVAGTGVKVAVIDSGIAPEHPMFAGTNFEAPIDGPDDDYCATVDAEFCNGKLIVARHYSPGSISEVEVDSPYDVDGHGTHVAGTAIGNTVVNSEGVELSGVAPGAYLMAYKALWSDGYGSAWGTTSNLIQALEDATTDGADVINNSWGSNASSYGYRLYTDVFGQIEAAGVVLVTSAGNSGPSASTVGCPACAGPGLAVASTDTYQSSADSSIVTFGEATYTAVPGGGVIHNTDLTALAKTGSSVEENNSDACASYESESFNEAIGIVYRGGATPDGGPCYFYVKAANLKAAGAQGMIVINNVPGDAIVMGGLTDLTFPSVMISEDQGVDLLNAYSAGNTITIGAFDDSELPVGTISSFSSRGPNVESSVLKPDIAAPGSPIMSAAIGSDDTAYVDLSGTSMASPHVAGAAAVLLQNSPDLTALEVKSALINSANPSGVSSGVGDEIAGVFSAGGGALDVEGSLKTALFWDTVSLSDGCVAVCNYSLSGTYKGDQALTFSIELALSNSNAVVEIPPSLSVSQGQTFELTFSVDVTSVEDGWLTGRVILVDASETVADASVPVSIYVGGKTDSDVLDVAGYIAAGQSSAISAAIAGAPDVTTGSAYELTISLPDGITLSESSLTQDARNVSAVSLTGDSEAGSVSWRGNLDEMTGSISEATFFGTGKSLKNDFEANITYDFSCDDVAVRPDGCDNVLWGYYVGNYDISLAGEELQQLAISSNGMIIFNYTSADIVSTKYPKALPSRSRPNNVIAPFWTDLSLGGDELGGNVLVGVVPDGADNWFVLEWWNAREKGGTDEAVTFSIWMREDSSDIYLNYGELGVIPSVLSVGVEDGSGASGVDHHFSGTGVAPSSGTSLGIDIQAFQGSATVYFDVVSESLAETVDASINAPANGSETIDLSSLTTPLASVSGSVSAELLVDGRRYDDQLNADIPAGPLMYSIVNQPSNGTVLSSDGGSSSFLSVYEYTPNPGFEGSDSFTYKVFDSGNGNSQSNTSTVTITIEDTGIDNDGDGLSDQEEYELGTDPFNPDSDSDYVNDGTEVTNGTDPNNPDTDGDGYDDGKELAAGTDPNDPSSYPVEEDSAAPTGLPVWMLYAAANQTENNEEVEQEEPETSVNLDNFSHSSGYSGVIINDVFQAGSTITSRLTNSTGANIAVTEVRFYENGSLRAQGSNYEIVNGDDLSLTWTVSEEAQGPITVNWLMTHDGNEFERSYVIYE